MRKFNRTHSRRKLFMKNLASHLVIREKMETTEARAKELKPYMERLVTIGKKQEVAGLRRLLAVLPKASAMKLYHEIAPRYAGRSGGYLRITKKSDRRKRDSAPVAVIEFVQ